MLEEVRQKRHLSNNRWALKRADSLKAAMGWDSSIPLGDMPFADLDVVFNDVFSRAVKVNGEPYPSASLMSICSAYNQMLKRASDLRGLRGEGNLINTTTFNLKRHLAFPKTRMVLLAAMKKSSREGFNKRRKKVETLTEQMEQTILSDIDHQITNPHGC